MTEVGSNKHEVIFECAESYLCVEHDHWLASGSNRSRKRLNLYQLVKGDLVAAFLPHLGLGNLRKGFVLQKKIVLQFTNKPWDHSKIDKSLIFFIPYQKPF